MAKKKKLTITQIWLGNIFGALILWIFILILFSLLNIGITDVFNIVEGDNEGATSFYNFMILYIITVGLVSRLPKIFEFEFSMN